MDSLVGKYADPHEDTHSDEARNAIGMYNLIDSLAGRQTHLHDNVESDK